MLRGSAAAIVVAIIAAGLVAASNMRNKSDTSDAEPVVTPVAAPITSPAPQPPTSTDTTTRSVATPAPAPVAQTASNAAAPVPPFDPVVPMGVSPLLNGMTALRSDTDVVVSFDLPTVRTRQPKKFEQIVRETLGAVFGTPAVQSLERVPDGGIASQGSLLTELPQRGVSIIVRPGWAIRVFPETRAGSDGPLVVRYRAVLAPASE